MRHRYSDLLVRPAQLRRGFREFCSDNRLKDRLFGTRLVQATHGRSLYQRKNLSPSYAFHRELYRGPAEARDGRGLKGAIAVLKSPGAVAQERAFLDSYGWTTEVVSANSLRKLKSPTLRDEPLAPFYTTMGELFN